MIEKLQRHQSFALVLERADWLKDYVGKTGWRNARQRTCKAQQSSASCCQQTEPIFDGQKKPGDKTVAQILSDIVQLPWPWALLKRQNSSQVQEWLSSLSKELEQWDQRDCNLLCQVASTHHAVLSQHFTHTFSGRSHPKACHSTWSSDPSELDKVGSILPQPASPCQLESPDQAHTRAKVQAKHSCQ